MVYILGCVGAVWGGGKGEKVSSDDTSDKHTYLLTNRPTFLPCFFMHTRMDNHKAFEMILVALMHPLPPPQCPRSTTML